MDSKLGGLIACIIYTVKKQISDVGEIAIFDNFTNKILMYSGNYDHETQQFKIFDYNRNSIAIGRNSQFIDLKSKEFISLHLTGMIFKGFISSQFLCFSGSIIGNKITIKMSDKHYTFECRQKS